MKGNGDEKDFVDDAGVTGGGKVLRFPEKGETGPQPAGEKEVMEFPCSFPLKVIGKNTQEFYAVVSAIIEKHVPGNDRITYSGRSSSGDKYLSITATFLAESREQLDAVYSDLNKHELVLYTL
jgi:putative lipoic acid-binding regulatory protein